MTRPDPHERGVPQAHGFANTTNERGGERETFAESLQHWVDHAEANAGTVHLKGPTVSDAMNDLPERRGASVEVVDAIKRKHWREEFPYGSGSGCHWCDEIWPCQTITLVTTITSLTAQLAERDEQIERLRAENKALQGDVMDSDHNELVHLRAENRALSNQIGVTNVELAEAMRKCEAMRGVVEAARKYQAADKGLLDYVLDQSEWEEQKAQVRIIKHELFAALDGQAQPPQDGQP